MGKRFYTFVLIFISCVSLYAGVEIETFLESYEAEFRWDDLRDVGLLESGSHSVSFKSGFDYILVDYTRKVFCPGLSVNDSGEVIVSQEAERVLGDIFGKDRIDPDAMKIAAIIIDPGHGGFDSGAVSPFKVGESRLMEKDVVLTIGLKLRKLLKKGFPDKKFIMTRSTDVYLKLEERTDIANNIKLGKNEAMIFVSIHANASPFNSKAEGFEVWICPEDHKKKVLTEDMIKDIPKQVTPIIELIVGDEINVETHMLADKVLKAMAAALGKNVVNRGIKENDWAVVRNSRMPSLLIEVGFVSHKKEAFRLNNNQYLQKIADGIYKGLCDFIESFESTNGFLQEGNNK